MWRLNNKVIPRGIRNNNPMNLVRTKDKWLGKIEKGKDKVFEQFERMEYGIRAGGIDIAGDIKKGKNTVEKLIGEFAPPHENNTKAYIAVVARDLKIRKEEVIEVNEENLKKLVRAIINHENGAMARLVTDKEIEIGVKMININKYK